MRTAAIVASFVLVRGLERRLFTSDIARHLYASELSCAARKEEASAAYMNGAPLELWIQAVTQSMAADSDEL